jgi:hypothetical protein
MRRPRKAAVIEFLLWVLVSIAVAAIMIALTDKILPAPNF